MTVELIDHMGTDLSVVNAARVSFGKKHTEMTKGDVGLINFLAKIQQNSTNFGKF